MKQVAGGYLLPLILAIAVLMALIFNGSLDSVFKDRTASSENPNAVYADKLVDFPQLADQLLMSGVSSDRIYLFGSSELTGSDSTWPYNFISDRFSTKVIGVGHAGNQCFSIYTQLLANKERLKHAPIVIMVSPTWFQGKDALGTSSAIFLEFATNPYLQKINRIKTNEFKDYFGQRLSEMYNDFTSPSLALKECYYDYQSSKSIFHKPFYGTFISIDRMLEGFKDGNTNTGAVSTYVRKPIVRDSVHLNWDSLYKYSKEHQLSLATNNDWGVNAEYYSTYVNGHHSEVQIVAENENVELTDFIMLVKMLKHYGADASFVIAPMNPYFYVGMKELEPVINMIRTEISSHDFPCLDMWVPDTTHYEKGLLRDVMHLGPYGWYKIDRFIIENYQLSK